MGSGIMSSLNTFKTTNSVASIGADILSKFEALRQKRITLGGDKGVFIADKHLNRLETKVHELMESGDSSISAEGLMALHDELSTLRKSSLIAEEALKASQLSVNVLKTDVARSEESLAAIQRQHASTVAAVTKEKAALKAQLFKAEAENKENHVAFNKAKHGFDPNEAVALKESYEASAAEVSRLNKLLASANTTISSSAEHLAASKKSVSDLVAQKAAMSAKLAQAQAAKAEAASIFAPPGPAKVAVAIDNALMTTLLGERGCAFIQEAAAASQNDVRARAYSTLMALRQGKSSTIRSLAAVLQVALDWIKAQTYKARLVLSEWLDELFGDVTRGVIKSIKHYRQRLEEIIGASVRKTKSVAISAAAKAHSSYESWSSDYVKSWVEVLYRRGKRACRNFWGKIRRPAKAVVMLPIKFVYSKYVSFWTRNYNTLDALHNRGFHEEAFVSGCPKCLKEGGFHSDHLSIHDWRVSHDPVYKVKCDAEFTRAASEFNEESLYSKPIPVNPTVSH